MRPAHFFIPRLIAVLWLLAGSAIAQQSEPEQATSGGADPAKLNAEVIKTMKAYAASLEKLVKIYEQDFKTKIAKVQEQREFYERGYVSRLELQQSQRELANAEAKLREAEQKVVEAKIAIAEATALEEFLRFPPLTAGGYIERGTFIRYNGKANWSLADAAKLQKFYSEKFGRLLPVSALGQTPFHERMKFDHREALDVALHPDSLEGKELIAYLRKSGIPFMAFRNGVPGSATGAHIHIGRPSVRVASE